ncbi:hypothetical protein PHJA_002733900 [Phtheirospermum japonicum]|uniref:Uncharacterized protein n=1 Tax=Phtheirospermum japonicum TaxID=374723 RepID=A0A830D803_9LAMI|nr:hypothetical protein PHJA_002733900 [Phtheirospermum japonicum]
MPRRNVDDEKNGKVRKRGCLSPSSSSLSSLLQNHQLKRAFLVGKKRGSTTPVPMWKMMSSSKSPFMENYEFVAGKNGERSEDVSVSARKLAAILWEINGVPSPGVKNGILEDKISEVGNFSKDRILDSCNLSSLSDPFCGNVSERMDPINFGSHRRKTATGFQKLQQADCNLGIATSAHNFLVQVDQMKNPRKRVCELKNQLNYVHNDLTSSKQLLKALIRVCNLNQLQLNSTSLSLIAALKIELNRAHTRVDNLIQGHNEISKELETEKKLMRRTEKRNEKLERELAETKVTLSREKKAREITELVCDELARGVGEDKAEVEKLTRKSERVRREIEKEREMFRLADLLREERVRMKLSEAKFVFEEKNALVEKLKNELGAYLKPEKKVEENGKVNEIEKYWRPGSCQKRDDEKNGDVEEKEDESDGSDLHSIELNADDIRKGLCELITSQALKRDDDEMERDKMIKDLRDHIVSCSRRVNSQELDS